MQVRVHVVDQTTGAYIASMDDPDVTSLDAMTHAQVSAMHVFIHTCAQDKLPHHA